MGSWRRSRKQQSRKRCAFLESLAAELGRCSSRAVFGSTLADAIAALLGQLGYPAAASSVRGRIRRMAADPGVVVLVAEESGTGTVCGVATFHFVPVLHEDPLRGQLTALIVSEAERRRGVGLALVQHVEQLAARQGVASLVVTTANHRTETHQFYDKLGYSWTGRRYAKDLRPGPSSIAE